MTIKDYYGNPIQEGDNVTFIMQYLGASYLAEGVVHKLLDYTPNVRVKTKIKFKQYSQLTKEYDIEQEDIDFDTYGMYCIVNKSNTAIDNSTDNV